MGLVRIHHGSREKCRRAGVHTHKRTHTYIKYNQLNGDRIIFTSTVRARINQQTPLGCRPQEASSLSKREGGGWLKQTEPQLFWIPNGALGSPTKHQIPL